MCLLACSRDHPRMCGEKPSWSTGRVIPVGSPPHVRGKVIPKAAKCSMTGITPACAGKSGP